MLSLLIALALKPLNLTCFLQSHLQKFIKVDWETEYFWCQTQCQLLVGLQPILDMCVSLMLSGLKSLQWTSHLCCFVFLTGAPRETRHTGWKASLFGVYPQVSDSTCLFFQDSLDAILQWLWHKHHREEVLRAGLCPEGALLLLEMLKATMNQVRPIPHMLRGVLMGRQAQKSQPWRFPATFW